MFILHRHASRNQTLGMVRRELLVEVSIPAQLRQVHSGVLIESFMAHSLRPSPTPTKAEVGDFFLPVRQRAHRRSASPFFTRPPSSQGKATPVIEGFDSRIPRPGLHQNLSR